MSDTNRRDFLKTTAATAATAALATGGAWAGGKETIKVGIIGCGGRGSGAAKDVFQADPAVRIVALGDAFKFRSHGLMNRLKNPKDKEFGSFVGRSDVTPETCFSGLDAYQKVIDAGVDYVVLATPPGFRPQHLEAAVKAGKHIFTEKPVAVDGPGIRKVLAAYDEAEKKGLKIAAGTQRRHQTGYLETMKRIHDGAIGEITGARCYWNGQGIWFHTRDDLKKTITKAKSDDPTTDLAYQLYNWYHFVWVCGDHIVEQHVHNLDVVNWAMKAHPVKAVMAMGGRVSNGSASRPAGPPNEVGHIFDTFAVEFEYGNGVRAFSFCRHVPGADSNVSEALVGTKGTCQVDRYVINNKPVISRDGDNAPYVQEHIDLIKAIRENQPLNELKNVAESTMTAILGRMATYTGKAVTWQQALNSKEDTFPKSLAWDTVVEIPPVAVPGKSKLV